MEHVGQVEVVKATASSMYGSGASNGVIHMRTAWPGDKPETVVSVFNGVYDTPDSTQWRWWDESYSPISSGMSASHRQAFGKLDIVAGGSVFSDKTYRLWATTRLRANAKFRYRFSPTWQFGGLGRANTNKWVDSSSGTISPPTCTCRWMEHRAKTVG